MAKRTVSISQDVYEFVAHRGRFGESFDDVVRRLLKVGTSATDGPVDGRQPTHVSRGRLSTRTVSPRVADGLLEVSVEGTGSRRWTLPDASDSHEIRRVTHEALAWAGEAGATEGQLKAI